MKPKIPKPPPVDTTLRDKELESEKKLENQRQKSLQIGRMGRAGTILTGGQGVTEEASVGKTILGGSSGNTY
tara:strand:+ start:2052 stop:2267 length:216 start_codon:yes stop_codon:yes gene_type:complete